MYKLRFLLVLILFLTGCSSALPSPSGDNAQTADGTPYRVLLPNVQAPGKRSPSLPEGAPLTEWNTIPIMPGALAGEETGNGYRFITEASISDIKAYYLETLAAAGWTEVSEGEAPNHLALVFQKDGDQTNITIDFLSDQNKSSVTIQR